MGSMMMARIPQQLQFKVHHVSPTYNCKECPFVAGKWSELRKHVRKEHLKEEDGGGASKVSHAS